MSCNANLVILVVILQIKTMFSRKTVLVLLESSLDQKNRRLAIKILICVTVQLSPCMICAIVLGNIEATLTDNEKGNLQFIFEKTIHTARLNSFTNAVLFLASNVKSKQYLRSFLKGNADNRVNLDFTKSKQKMSLPMNTFNLTVSSECSIANAALIQSNSNFNYTNTSGSIGCSYVTNSGV